MSAYSWYGPEHLVLQAAKGGRYRLVVSSPILHELGRVMLERFDQPRQDITGYLVALRRLADLVHPTMHVRVVNEDPDDDRILECAVAGRAGFIVTGDKHLLSLRMYRGIRIVRAPEFLRLLR